MQCTGAAQARIAHLPMLSLGCRSCRRHLKPQEALSFEFIISSGEYGNSAEAEHTQAGRHPRATHLLQDGPGRIVHVRRGILRRLAVAACAPRVCSRAAEMVVIRLLESVVRAGRHPCRTTTWILCTLGLCCDCNLLSFKNCNRSNGPWTARIWRLAWVALLHNVEKWWCHCGSAVPT